MRICYAFPSKGRPTRFFKAIENIEDMSASEDFVIIAKLDEDDESMNNDEIKSKLTEYEKVIVKWGKSEGKIHAINRSLEDIPPFDIIIIMSDDIIWDVFGFDDEIREAFKKFYPNLDGTIHWPDDHGKSDTIIVSVLGVNLYKEFGYLYNPIYESVFCDNEFTHIVKLMGKYVFVNKRLFTHDHPIWTNDCWDTLYRHNERAEVYRKDGEIFKKRKSENFGM